MSKKESYEAKTEELLLPIIEANGFELVDVEYVKEGSNWYLRAYIDKPGGITIDDCELVSRALSEILDREDYISEAYILEVSSPGLLRPIKKEKDYERNLEKQVEIRTYQMLDKKKEFVGTLTAFDKDTVTIVEEGQERIFEKSQISLIRPYVEF
ncbi:MAG: ribosome maturation factor RimP [Roseburia sp.]|nr:ribosome maturation factor RimP [Roseburia sp.]MCM1280195.1 ribosome maturation factor RimP [Robinsoniella sp.]